MLTEQPVVCIIVIAYNNEETIAQCLESLEAQEYSNKELTVVYDKSSRDSTGEVLVGTSAMGMKFKVIECSGVGRSKARNLGWRATLAPVVMFADGDDVYDPEYIKRAIDRFESGYNIGGVCLGGAPLIEGESLLDKYNLAYGPTDSRFNPAKGAEPDWAWIYRRECLDKVSGFNEEMSQTEDRDLCRRVKECGYHIAYVPGVNWHHRKPRRLGELLNKQYNGAKRRVFNELSHGGFSFTLRRLVPVLFILCTLLLLFVIGLLAVIGFLILGILAYALTVSSAFRGHIGRSLDWPGLVFVAMTGNIVSAVGALSGLVFYGLSKAKLIRIDKGRF